MNTTRQQPGLIQRVKWRARQHLVPRPQARAHRHAVGAPVVVAGLFSTASGIGESARLCARRLEQSGLEVIRLDLSALFEQVELGSSQTEPLCLPNTQECTLIVHLNAPELDAVLFRLRQQIKPRWRIIAYWAWELSLLPPNWRGVTRHLTEIWTPSEFVSEVVRGVVDVPVVTVPHGVAAPKTIRRRRKDTTTLSACIMADGRSSFERKNVMGSIEMFRHAFRGRDDVRLNVKLRNLAEFPGFSADVEALAREDGRVGLLDETLGPVDRWDVLERSDVILSAHRAEGFGLHLAEAMSIGVVPVATNWSGNMQFMCPETACLLDYRLVPVRDPFGVYSKPSDAHWAAPDLGKGIESLRALAEKPDRLAHLSHMAARALPRRLDCNAYFNALGVMEKGSRHNGEGPL